MNRYSLRAERRLALLLVLAPCAARAQVTTPPVLGPAPALTLPAVERATLPNGITVLVSRNAEVPIVEARLMIAGGARAAGITPGLPAFAASTVMEGAAGRSAVELAQAIDVLGARITAGTDWNDVVISLRAQKRNVGDAMALMADVALHPDFKSTDVQRLRALRLAAFTQARDRPTAVAARVFFRNVFPAGNPYHVDIGGDSTGIAGFDSTTVREFWNRAINPRRTTFIVTGDVTLAEAKAWITKQFGHWKAPANPLTVTLASTVAAAPHPATRVILVDKPNAAQSVIYIGEPGVSRSSPDYPAVALMNTILGGSFSSRLNDFLREQLGYTYGANSSFQWEPVPGPFIASAQVRTNVTDSSLMVFFRELKRIGTEPVTPVELTRGKNYFVLGALDHYETAGEVAGALVTSVELGRALSTIPPEYAAVEQLTVADVERAARIYLDPSHMTVVVVGDLAKIRPGIEKLGLGAVSTQAY